MSWPRLPQQAKACKFHYLFDINEGLGSVLILINTGPSIVDASLTVWDFYEKSKIKSSRTCEKTWESSDETHYVLG